MPKKVYFNATCPVCNAGVTSQRDKMARREGADAVEWQDINEAPEALADRRVSLDDVRLKLYVEDEAGRLHVGADAFATLWRGTPGQRWLGWLISRPVVAPVVRWLYDRFADRLYAWNRRKGRW